MISSGDTLTSAKSTDFFSRATNSIVRVASTSTNTDTCGAVNAESTMPLAMALRTPLTGIRSSRSPDHSGVSRFLKTLACFAAPTTSSRVTSPATPVPSTCVRSTSRSFASLRMGGFAMTGEAPTAGIDFGTSGRFASGGFCTVRGLRRLVEGASRTP